MRIFKSLGIIVIPCLVMSTAIANECPGNFKYLNDSSFHFLSTPSLSQGVSVRGKATSAQKAAMLQSIDRVNQFLRPEVLTPSHIHLDTDGADPLGAFSYAGFQSGLHLVGPFHYSWAGKSKIFEALLMHEYGHLLFDTNLEQLAKEQYPKLAQLLKLRIRGGEILRQFELASERFSQLADLRKKALLSRNEKLLEKTVSMLNRNEEQIALLRKEANEINRQADNETLKVLLPYEELYSDLIATSVSNNPKAMLLDLLVIHPHAWRELRKRDASIKHPVGRWQHSDPHVLFAPTLSHIWHSFLSKAPGAEQKPWVIKKVTQAIAHELNERLLDESLIGIEPKEANRRLIDRINREILDPDSSARLRRGES